MTPTEKVVSALYRIIGLHSLNENQNNIPLYNLYSGVLIGLRIGITDIHTAKLVQQALGNGELDPITQVVVDEIMSLTDE